MLLNFGFKPCDAAKIEPVIIGAIADSIIEMSKIAPVFPKIKIECNNYH